MCASSLVPKAKTLNPSQEKYLKRIGKPSPFSLQLRSIDQQRRTCIENPPVRVYGSKRRRGCYGSHPLGNLKGGLVRDLSTIPSGIFCRPRKIGWRKALRKKPELNLKINREKKSRTPVFFRPNAFQFSHQKKPAPHFGVGGKLGGPRAGQPLVGRPKYFMHIRFCELCFHC